LDRSNYHKELSPFLSNCRLDVSNLYLFIDGLMMWYILTGKLQPHTNY